MFFWEHWGKDGIEGFVLLRGLRAPLRSRAPAQGTACRGAGPAALLQPRQPRGLRAGPGTSVPFAARSLARAPYCQEKKTKFKS